MAETDNVGLGSRQPAPKDAPNTCIVDIQFTGLLLPLELNTKNVHNHGHEETRAARRAILLNDDCQLLAG